MNVDTSMEKENFSFSCNCQVRQNKAKTNHKIYVYLWWVWIGELRKIKVVKAILKHCTAFPTAFSFDNSFLEISWKQEI